jgi:hypothetical protein
MLLSKSIMVNRDNVVRVDFVIAAVAVVVGAVGVSSSDWPVVADIRGVVVMLFSFVSTLATLSRRRCCVRPDASLWTHCWPLILFFP